MTPPHNPFSTLLAISIMQLIAARDAEIARIKATEPMTTDFRIIDGQLADDIKAACVRTLATLETTVNTILVLQSQMKVLRDANAG